MSELINIDVEVISLDSFTEENSISPDLIKIDTEGFELNVLTGSKNILEKSKPIIVLECNTANEKQDVFEKFNSFDYSVYEFNDLNKKLNSDTFESSKNTNFVACHNSVSLPQSF